MGEEAVEEADGRLVAEAAVGVGGSVGWTGLYGGAGDGWSLDIEIAGADSSGIVFEGELFTVEHAVAVLSTQLVVVRIGTCCSTGSIELKSIRWTNTRLIACKQPPTLLPRIRLINFTIANLQNLVPTLLKNTDFGPIRVNHQYKRRFEVQIEARLVASRDIGYVGENGIGEAI